MSAPRLMTLEDAAAALHETVTVSSLRAAIREGRLPRRKLGRRYYVTSPEIEDFLRCLAHASLPASTSAPMNSNGSSGTESASSGRDMALASVERLKMRSRDTSRAASRPSGAVLPIRAS